jgi:hypothetical protein
LRGFLAPEITTALLELSTGAEAMPDRQPGPTKEMKTQQHVPIGSVHLDEIPEDFEREYGADRVAMSRSGSSQSSPMAGVKDERRKVRERN